MVCNSRDKQILQFIMNYGDISQDTSGPKSVNWKWQSRKVEGIIEIIITCLTAIFFFFFLLAYFKQNRKTENYSSEQKLKILPLKSVAWLRLYFWFELTECSAQDACSISLLYLKSKSLKLPAAQASSRSKQSISRR